MSALRVFACIAGAWLTAVAVVSQEPEPVRLPAALFSRDYSCELAARGGEGRLRFVHDGGDLPPGLGLDADGVVAGRPTERGRFRFLVSVSDELGARFGPVPYEIEVLAPPVGPLRWALDALPMGYEQIPYEAVLRVEGGHPPYRWSVIEGEPGVALDASSGRLHGVPGRVGRTDLRFAVTDSSGEMLPSPVFALEVHEGPVLDELRIVGPRAWSLVAGFGFTAEIGVAGGLAPFGIALTEGPDWLRLDGRLLTAEPEVEGDHRATLRVTDRTGRSVEEPLVLRVAANPWRVPLAWEGDVLTPIEEKPSHWVAPVRGGTPPYELRLLEGPEWLRVEGGLLRGDLPEERSPGPSSVAFRVEVADAQGRKVVSPPTSRLTLPEVVAVAAPDGESGADAQREGDVPSDSRWIWAAAGLISLLVALGSGYLWGRRSGRRLR